MIIPADGAPRLPLQLDSFNNAIFYTQLPLLLCLSLPLFLPLSLSLSVSSAQKLTCL